MDKQLIRKRMNGYVLPSVISFAILSIYVFVDAVFVGNKVGELGIAAINIAFSIIALTQAIGSGIGIGAAVKYTIKKAEGNGKEAEEFAGGAFKMLLTVGAAMTIVLTAFSKPLMRFLGASENITEIGNVYLKTQGIFSYFMIFCEGLLALCRNNEGNKAAMRGVVAGCLSNCFLDWLFIYKFEWGMFGASFASALGQLITLFFIVSFMLKKKVLFTHCPTGRLKQISKDIIKNGITPFACVFVPNISVIIINNACLKYGTNGGDKELGIYGIVAFLVYCVYMIIQGSTDGAQPLISFFRGKKDLKSYIYSANLTFRITLVFAVIFGAFELFLREKLVTFMGAGSLLLEDCARVLAIFTPGFLFVAVSRTAAAIFYASERNYMAYAISFSEPAFLLLVILIICPSLGVNGIWYSVVAAQGIVALFAVILSVVSRKQISKWF